jgi:hypothetical protein
MAACASGYRTLARPPAAHANAAVRRWGSRGRRATREHPASGARTTRESGAFVTISVPWHGAAHGRLPVCRNFSTILATSGRISPRQTPRHALAGRSEIRAVCGKVATIRRALVPGRRRSVRPESAAAPSRTRAGCKGQRRRRLRLDGKFWIERQLRRRFKLGLEFGIQLWLGLRQCGRRPSPRQRGPGYPRGRRVGRRHNGRRWVRGVAVGRRGGRRPARK